MPASLHTLVGEAQFRDLERDIAEGSAECIAVRSVVEVRRLGCATTEHTVNADADVPL